METKSCNNCGRNGCRIKFLGIFCESYKSINRKFKLGDLTSNIKIKNYRGDTLKWFLKWA